MREEEETKTEKLLSDVTALGQKNVSRRKVIGSVSVYLRTTHLVRVKYSERRRVNVDSNEILSAYFWISELVNIGHVGPGHCSRGTLAAHVVAQAAFLLVAEGRFPHKSSVDTDDTMRSVVVVNRCFLTGPPADNQHLDGCITTNPVTPVISLFKSQVRLYIDWIYLDIRQPRTDLFERWWGGLGVQLLDEFGKRQRTGRGRRGQDSFRINRCRQSGRLRAEVA